MNDRPKQVLLSIITFSLYALFLYLVVLTVIIPIYRLVICREEDVFNLNLLTIVGSIVGFISIVLAIVFQYVSSASSRRVESAVNSINETVISVKTIAEDINHKQDVINATSTVSINSMSPQIPPNGWTPDPSK